LEWDLNGTSRMYLNVLSELIMQIDSLTMLHGTTKGNGYMYGPCSKECFSDPSPMILISTNTRLLLLLAQETTMVYPSQRLNAFHHGMSGSHHHPSHLVYSTHFHWIHLGMNASPRHSSHLVALFRLHSQSTANAYTQGQGRIKQAIRRGNT
jgi:hypothetical protein